MLTARWVLPNTDAIKGQTSDNTNQTQNGDIVSKSRTDGDQTYSGTVRPADSS